MRPLLSTLLVALSMTKAPTYARPVPVDWIMPLSLLAVITVWEWPSMTMSTPGTFFTKSMERLGSEDASTPRWVRAMTISALPSSRATLITALAASYSFWPDRKVRPFIRAGLALV